MGANAYIAGLIVTMALATFITRATPFVLLSRFRESPFLTFIGKKLPPAMMLILVVYCLKDLDSTPGPRALATIAAVGVVTIVHLVRRNVLLSLFSGWASLVLLHKLLVL